MKYRIVARNVLLYIPAILPVFMTVVLAQFNMPPGLKWRTIETDHFFIHYPQQYFNTAREVIYTAEAVFDRITPIVHHIPKERTHIVLADFYDLPLDYTLAVLYNAIYLSPTQLKIGLGHYHDFIYLILLHEYCHVLDLDMINGLPEIGRKIIGRFYSPNQFSPIWMIEGFATYMETELSNGGRGIDPYYDMYLRAAFNESNIPQLDQLTLIWDSWPNGTVPYLYGESLYRFMAGTDTDKAVFFRHAHKGNLWPFSFGGDLAYYWRGSIPNAYLRWKNHLHNFYKKQTSQLEKAGITHSRQVTFDNYNTWDFAWSEDDKSLYYFNNNYHKHAAIKNVNLQSLNVKKIKDVNSYLPQLSLDGEGGKLYFTQIDIYNKSAIYSDVNVYNLKSGACNQITNKERTFDPDIHDDNFLIYLKINQGKTDLIMKDETGRKSTIIEGTKNTFYFSPRWSPKGDMIAMSCWEQGGYRDIYIYDLIDEQFYPIMKDRAWDITPSWSPDGEYILFASDRTGVFNIFAYRLADKSFFQLSNMQYGAFCPKLSNDGKKIGFVGYSSVGFNLYLMQQPEFEELLPINFEANKSKDTVIFKYGFRTQSDNETIDEKEQTKNDKLAESGNYNPIKTLLKPMRFPVIAVDDTGSVAGIQLLGKDVLGQHLYSILAAYSLEHKRLTYQLDYVNSQFYPNIYLHSEDFVNPHKIVLSEQQNGDDLYWERVKNNSIAVEIPFPKIDYQLNFLLGLSHTQHSSASESLQNRRLSTFTGTLFSYYSQISYSNAKSYLRSIWFEEGLSVSTTFQKYLKLFSGNRSFYTGDLSLRKFFRMPATNHHVFQLSAGAKITNIQDNGNHISDLSANITGYGNLRWIKSFLNTGIQYRFPVINIERGYRTWPIYMRQIHGSLFHHFYRYQNLFDSTERVHISGSQIFFDFVFFYNLPLTISVGYVNPWHRDGKLFEQKIFWELNLSFDLLKKLKSKTINRLEFLRKPWKF